MIRLKNLVKKVGLPKEYIADLIRRRKFPEPNLKGAHPEWHEHEIDQWMLGKWEK